MTSSANKDQLFSINPTTSYCDELVVRHLIKEATFFQSHLEADESFDQQAQDCIDKAGTILSRNIRETFINYSNETIILFAETAIQVRNKQKLAEQFVTHLFQRDASQGQMYIRALLLKAQLIAKQGFNDLLKAEEMLSCLTSSLSHVYKALELISKDTNKLKYSFLIYNTSVCVYNILRPLLKPLWARNFMDIIEKIDKLFDDVDETDFNWRCRFTLLLFQCMYDADKKAEAFKLLEKLWDNTKKKGECDFQDTLLKVRLHYGQAQAKKDAETAPPDKGWKMLSLLQQMKSALIPEAQIEKELINLINSISPSVLPGQELTGGSNKLKPVFQDRLAEAGRIALQYNLVNIADSVTNFLARVRHLNQRAYILNEYNKAELLVKKAGSLIDAQTGMRLNRIQIKKQEIERRADALRILEKAMTTNRRVNIAELIYEGALLIWNLGLPFLNQQLRSHIYKSFLAAASLLELIQSNDSQLRVNLHFEIAKNEMDNDMVPKAEAHIKKLMLLDYSVPLKLITQKIDPGEALHLYQRPYDRYLLAFKEKVRLKTNIYDDPNDDIERVILDLERADDAKTENMRIDILQKCLGMLYNMHQPEYYYDPSLDLVEEEIQSAKVKFEQEKLNKYKQKKLLSNEIAKLAFEWEMIDLSMKACQFVFDDTWEIKNASEMVLSQVECHYIMSQCYTELLLKEGYEIAFTDAILVNVGEEQEEAEIGNKQQLLPTEQEIKAKEDNLKRITDYKGKTIKHYQDGIKLAAAIGQTWLIFNGAIYLWNNYLPVFRNPINDKKLLPGILDMLGVFFDTMKASMKELEQKNVTDYDLEAKIQVYANIGLVYARLQEGNSKYDEVMRICEALLLTPLSPHTRKLINSIKARVSGVAKSSNIAIKTEKGGKGGAQGAGSAAQQQQQGDSVIFDVVSQLEIIQNSTNKALTQDLIKKCFETLLTWNAKQNDETELELHAELWARLARLALNEQTSAMYKYALRSVKNSLSLSQRDKNIQQQSNNALQDTNNQTQQQSPAQLSQANAKNGDENIPQQRIRWYSLADYLYSETLVRMLNPDTQEKESQEKLLFHALKHAVEAAHKGAKAQIGILVLDASKQIWNICAKLQDSALNRKTLIKPIVSTFYYLRQCKEISEPDLPLLLSQLLFKAALENQEYQLGESLCNMVFDLIPKNLQKPIWEAKMIFMSKQGKNELQAISNMKEADASLQAKMWIRLARASSNVYKQYTAYSKAIEILKKETSVEIVEEFGEWLLRNNYDVNIVQANLLMASDILIDIELDDEEDEEDEDNEARALTIFSRSSRGKRSSAHSSKKSGVSKTRLSQANKSQLKHRMSGQSKVMKKSGDLKSQKSRKSLSRMSRVSQQRDSQNVQKSKQSKSIFTQREEESIPEKLNCLHYERLMKIHSMLAQVAQSAEQQIQYCLDAKFFLMKVIELSFQTMNQQDYNAIFYSVKKQTQQAPAIQPVGGGGGGKGVVSEKDKQTANVPLQTGKLAQPPTQQQNANINSTEEFKAKYCMPRTALEWLELQFSPEFLEKAQKSEDFSFMGKFIFEKAELTYHYINQVILFLEKYGLHVHTVPLYVFNRFMAQEIISNQFLALQVEARFAKVLFNIGFQKQGKEMLQNLNMKLLNQSPAQKREYLIKVEASQIQQKNAILSDTMEQNQTNKDPQSQQLDQTNISNLTQIRPINQTMKAEKPFLIEQFQVHVLWVALSRELICMNEISTAKELLEEALKHAKILQDVECAAEIHILFAHIAYLEGDYKQSLSLHMTSHKWIRSLALWEESIKGTVKALKKLSKKQDLREFVNKFVLILNAQMTPPAAMNNKNPNESNLQEQRQQQEQMQESQWPFLANPLVYYHCLSCCYILRIKFAMHEMKSRFSYEMFRFAAENFSKLEANMKVSSIGLSNLDLLLEQTHKFALLLEQQSFSDSEIVQKCYKMLETTTSWLNVLEGQVRGLLKYTVLEQKDTQLSQKYYKLIKDDQQLQQQQQNTADANKLNIQSINQEQLRLQQTGPLNQKYTFIKILLAKQFNLQGVLKVIMRTVEFSLDQQLQKETQARTTKSTDMLNDNDGSLDPFADAKHEANKLAQEQYQQQQLQEPSSPMSPKMHTDEKLNNYLTKLSVQIERQLIPIPQRLESFEKAVAVLTSLFVQMSNDTELYIFGRVEHARAKRLLAVSKDLMKDVWGKYDKKRQKEVIMMQQENLKKRQEELARAQKIKEEKEMESDNEGKDKEENATKQQHDDETNASEDPLYKLRMNVDFKRDSLENMLDLSQNEFIGNNASNLLLTQHAYSYKVQMCLEMLENVGNMSDESGVESMSEFQHYQNLRLCYSTLKESAPTDFKPLLLKRLSKLTYRNYNALINQELVTRLKNSPRVYDMFFNQVLPFQQIVKEILPLNSAYLILQLSPDRQYLYVGFLRIGKSKDVKETITIAPSGQQQAKPDTINQQQQQQQQNQNQQDGYQYFAMRKKMKRADLELLTSLSQQIDQIKQALIKTPIITDEEFTKLEIMKNDEYKSVIERLSRFCRCFTKSIDPFLNQADAAKEQSSLNVTGTETGGGKKGGKDTKAAVQQQSKDTRGAKKGAGTDEVTFYESPLTASSTGVESLVLLADNEFSNLPFLSLDVFSKVPAKSKDFSLQILAKRYKFVQFNYQMNNSIGLNRTQLKYISYDFKPDAQGQSQSMKPLSKPEQQMQQLQTQKDNQSIQPQSNNILDEKSVQRDTATQQFNMMNTTSNTFNTVTQQDMINIVPFIKQSVKAGTLPNLSSFEGTTSRTRIASIGEWQKYLCSASLLLFYGHTSILDILSPKLFCDMLEVSQTKGFLILDRVNSRKALIDKANPLDALGEKTPIFQQPLKQQILLTLLGSACIGINQWSVQPSEQREIVESMFQQFNSEIYIAATMNQYKEQKITYLDRTTGQVVDVEKKAKEAQEKRELLAQQKVQQEKKKGGKGVGGNINVQPTEEQQLQDLQALAQDEFKIEDLIKKVEQKSLLCMDNLLFVGIPIIRLS